MLTLIEARNVATCLGDLIFLYGAPVKRHVQGHFAVPMCCQKRICESVGGREYRELRESQQEARLGALPVRTESASARIGPQV